MWYNQTKYGGIKLGIYITLISFILLPGGWGCGGPTPPAGGIGGSCINGACSDGSGLTCVEGICTEECFPGNPTPTLAECLREVNDDPTKLEFSSDMTCSGRVAFWSDPLWSNNDRAECWEACGDDSCSAELRDLVRCQVVFAACFVEVYSAGTETGNSCDFDDDQHSGCASGFHGCDDYLRDMCDLERY